MSSRLANCDKYFGNCWNVFSFLSRPNDQNHPFDNKRQPITLKGCYRPDQLGLLNYFIMNIEDLSTAPLSNSLFIKPMEIHYRINGHNKKWDYIECHDSVAIIIFNVSRRTLVCVKQFRPAVYVQNIPLEDRKGTIDLVKYPPDLGITVEFCAGIVDKNKPLSVIAKEEVLEETGYDVSLENLHKIKVFKSNVGNAVDEIHLFYTEVDDSMKKSNGGGLEDEGEYIEVVELTLEEARKICEETTTPNNYCGFLYGLLWFLHNKSAYFYQTCGQSST